MEVVRFGSRDELVDSVIQILREELSRKSSQLHGVVLSGGSTPLAIYNKIAANPFSVDQNAYITYSDERYVPIDSDENNYKNTKPMLDALKIPAERILNVKTELGYVEASNRFHQALDKFFSSGTFPLGLLGMGTDGHTASLFSLEDVRRGNGSWSIPVTKEQPPHRISVTREFLNRVEKIIILLTGKEKLEMLDRLIKEPETIPCGLALVNHPNATVWLAE